MEDEEMELQEDQLKELERWQARRGYRKKKIATEDEEQEADDH